MQQPTAEEGAILKRDWWQNWEHKNPPNCDFIIQSYDTAFLKKESADFSAITTWGVWTDDDGKSNIILLNAFKDRYELLSLLLLFDLQYLQLQMVLIIQVLL